VEKINATPVVISTLKGISEAINDSEILAFKKDPVRWLKRKSIDLDNYSCRPILPGSGNHLTVRIDSEGRYTLGSTINNNIEGLLYESKPRGKRKVILPEDLGDTFLRSLRLSQMIIVAFSQRLGDEDIEKVYVPDELIFLLTSIEGVMDGDVESNKEQLGLYYRNLSKIYENRINHLQKEEFADLVKWLGGRAGPTEYKISGEALLGQEIENAFFEYGEHQDVNFSNYLGGTKPTEHNFNYVSKSVNFALKELFLPSEWLDSKGDLLATGLEKEYPLPKLKPHDVEDGLYDEVISNCGPILDALRAKSEENPDDKELPRGVKECTELMFELQEKITIEKLVTDPPSKLQKELDQITIEFELFEQMKISLKNNLPGLFDTLKESDTDVISSIYQKSANIRFDISACQQIISDVRNLIREKSSSKDFEWQKEGLEKKAREYQKLIQETRHRPAELQQLQEEFSILKKEMLNWKAKVEDRLSKVTSDDSLLWIGLGQAGGQILRECMMYCLENLNDARCTALLRALGISKKLQEEISNLIKRTHSPDKDKCEKAEEELKRIAHNNLHILAINLGEEIDKLVVKGEPGYFIWGDEVEYDRTSRVTRGKRNTLKLNASGEGAGGRTGLGRAFGFRYHQEISDVMRDVGMNKGGRKPKHIVITHSYAGGSGSGMVLPVLQQVRRTFGGNAIIWVLSVGGGDAERKVASHFNTPFILSDVLQAHYDGIHAIMEPVKVSEWTIFKGSIKHVRDAMNVDMKNLLNLISDSPVNDKEIMKNFEQKLEHRHKSNYFDKKNRVYISVKIINDSKFPYEIKNGIKQFSSLEDLEKGIANGTFFSTLGEILPSNREETKKFNKWCEDQELGGIRPALDMWLNWIECETDPLGYFIQGRERDKQTIADDSDGNVIEQQFVPHLTSNHLNIVLANICLNQNIESEEAINAKHLAKGLEPLSDVLEESFSGTDEEKLNMYNEIKNILTSYGGSLDQYNSLREKMTGQIMSMSGASSDARIKCIVISNAHLELGVNTTQDLKVSSSTYTVYNSVIFDLMLNIIAPRLPTEPGVFINTDAEEFDEQDLLTHTHPPLVVGLLNQRDSISLTEPPLVADTTRHGMSDSTFPEVLGAMFSSVNVSDGFENPLNGIIQTREDLTRFFLSMFGRRYLYILQHNPYNGIVDASIPTKLSEFVMRVIEKWNSSANVFGLNEELRKNLSFSEGITSEHIGNMIYWFSLIDEESLARMISQDKDEPDSIVEEWRKNGWLELRPDNPEQMDMQQYSIAPTISKFLAQEKITLNQKIILMNLPKLGIWNGSILRTVGASHLNSYLPIELLFHEGEEGINPEKVNLQNVGIPDTEMKQYHQALKMILEMIREKHELKNEGYLRDDSQLQLLVENQTLFDATNKMLEEVELKLDYIKSSNRFRLSLHPRVLRYFSAFRDVPMKPDDLLLPARSTGASLARYLHADSLGGVLDSSKPPTGISSPTFVKGGEILNYMRYFGLLPDEKRLSLVPLMRILLLGSGSSDEFKRRLSTQAKLVGLDFETISPYLEQILDQQKYEKLDVYNQPLAYCLQAEVLHKRLKITKSLAEHLSESPPSHWSSNDKLGLDTWLKITNYEDILLEFEGDENLFGDDRESLSTLKEWLHELRLLTHAPLSGNTIEEENSESSSDENEQIKETVSGENSIIIAIKQLFFDISSVLSESIGQAEYMNPDFKSRRVHFEMTGFSDRLMGKPDGLLLLVHDRNPKLQQDAIRRSVREGIEYSVGSLGDPKEYFTAADFGPTSCITMVFQKAPLASVADKFKDALEDDESGLSSRNPNKYQDITRLHPYIFLYNLLWLSVHTNKWTSAANVEFIRSFQIPTKIIEHHYQNPENIPEMVKAIETHESYRLGQVRMPQDDQRDFNNAMKVKERGVRNIVPLIGIMALRHEKAGGLKSKQYWKECEITKDQYDKLILYSGHQVSDLADKIYLDPKSTEEQSSAGEPSDLEKLLEGLGGRKSGGVDAINTDDLKSRTKAWFKAYVNWLKFTGEEENDLGSKADEANLFSVGEQEIKVMSESNLEQPTAAVPPIPAEGLPSGWSLEQWRHYGAEWLRKQ